MTAHTPGRIRSWATVAALAITGILAVGQTYAVLGLVDPMVDDLDVSSSAVATATTIFGITYACGFLLAGPLVGRFGAKPVLVVALAAASLTALAVAAPSSLTGVLVVRAVQGFVTAGFAPCALVYVTQQLPARLRTFATTSLTTAFLASAVVMPLIAGPVGHAWGWKGVFIASAAALAACAAVLGALLDHGSSTSVPVIQAFAVLPRIIRRGRMFALLIATAAVLGAYVSLFTALQLSDSVEVAEFPGGLPGLRVATLPALVLVTVLSVSLQGISARRRAVSGFSIAAVGAGIVAFGNSTPAVAGGVIVFVAAIALTTPALVARIVEMATPTETAAVTSWYGAFMFLGAGIGPAIAAPAQRGSLTVALILVIVLTLVGAVLVILTRGPLTGSDAACQRRVDGASVVS